MKAITLQRVSAAWRCLFLLSFSALLPTPAAAAAAHVSPLTIHDCSFGEVYAFSAAACTFTVENNGPRPLSLSIVPMQSGTTAEPAHLLLDPHARADVAAQINTENSAGESAWAFRIEGAPGEPTFAQAKGFVMSVLDEPHPKIAFGDVEPAKGPTTKLVELTSSLVPGVRIEKVLSIPDFLHAKPGDDSGTLVAEMGSDAPWGPFAGTIKLAVDTPQQKQIWVKVTGNVVGEVGPEKNPYWFGTVPWQPDRTLSLPLIERDGRDFTLGAVTADGIAATFDSGDCDPPRRGCRAVRIHVVQTQRAGFFKADLDVALPDRNRHLNVTVLGVFDAKPAPKGTPSAPPEVKKPASLQAEADDKAPPPLKVQPEPPGDGPLLKWTVEHQEGTYGYQIFRSYTPDGPFAVVDARILPALDNGKGAVKYQWRDTSAIKGRTYWYYISVIAKDGGRKALSKPLKALAK